jgi:DnaJ like chaperone protein
MKTGPGKGAKEGYYSFGEHTMWFGTVIGGLLGLSIGGGVGAAIGALAGHFFDRGLAKTLMGPNPAQKAKIERVFFKTLFLTLGQLAKADGRISEEEIRQTEHFMAQMELNADHRREAIELFKTGAEPGFALATPLREFMEQCSAYPNLKHILLVYLVGVALADGVLHEAEEQLLRQVAQRLNFSAAAFEQLMAMIKAQDSFAHGQAHSGSTLDVQLAYQALGVSEQASDKEIKRAYRRLMSEYHPDKLIGQGLPQDMVKTATERSQEVQTAYDAIRKFRKNQTPD